MNKEAAERLWQKTQKDEIFPQFEQYIIVEFGTRDAFDILCDTPEKKFKEFAQWKLKTMSAVH